VVTRERPHLAGCGCTRT